MPKVLACPVCGNKHSLDLLVGLDTFACSECGKKLAVPQEAIPGTKKHSEDVVAISTSSNQDKNGSNNFDDDASDIVVVARSSMDPTRSIEDEAPSVVAQSSSEQPEVRPNKSDATHHDSLSSGPQKGKAHTHSHHVPQFALPLFGNILAWGIALPAGFIMVVIIPRFFGYGFHASDFVGVITHQGLGRYKIVVALVALWSIATVLSLSVVTSVVKRLFRARKRAV